jgi:hypothetical protein
MLKVVHEPHLGPVSFAMSSTLTALATTNLRNVGSTDLNEPYGASDTTLPAGMIMQLVDDGGTTSLVKTDATRPIGILADSFVDGLKSGFLAIYLLCTNGIYDVKECYDIGQTYAVNTLLTVIGSGTNQGKLTPATNYGAQPIVAMVVDPPASAANDDIMRIMTIGQIEGVA